MPYLLLTGALLVAARPDPAAPVVRFARVTAAAYEQARRQARPVKPPVSFPLRARQGRLTIPTTAGSQVYRDVVIDAAAAARGHSEAENTRYTYHGLLTRFRRHVVQVRFFETEQWWLIGPDGRRLTLYGEPQYSPDGQRVAAMCAGLEYGGGQPNILQLYELQNGVLRRVWELQPESWEPEDLFWTGPGTLYLKREEYPGGRQGPVSYWQLTVAFRP